MTSNLPPEPPAGGRDAYGRDSFSYGTSGHSSQHGDPYGLSPAPQSPNASGQGPYLHQDAPGAGSPEAAQQAADAAKVKEQFAKARAKVGNPLPSLLAALAAYGSGLVWGVVIIATGFLATLFLGDAGADSLNAQAPQLLNGFKEAFDLWGVVGIVFVLGLPAQIVSTAFFAPFSVGLHLSGPNPMTGDSVSGSLGISVFSVSLVVLAVVLTVAWMGGKKVERRAPGASHLALWGHSALAALSVALVGALLPWAMSFRKDVAGEQLGGPEHMGLVMGAGGFVCFFAMFTLLTLALVAGRYAVRPAPRWWSSLHEFGSAAKLFALHSVGYTVVAMLLLIPVLLLEAVIGGEDVLMTLRGIVGFLLYLPSILGHVVAVLFGLGSLSAIHASIDMGMGGMFGGFTDDATVWLFTGESWWRGALLLLLTLLFMMLAGIVWSQHRPRPVAGNIVQTSVQWAVLPAAYFLCGALFFLVARISMGLNVGGDREFLDAVGSTFRFSASATLAPWTPLIFGLLGAVVELISRFVAPFVAKFVPSRVGALVHRPRPAGYVDAPADGAPANAAPGSAFASSGAGVAGAGAGVAGAAGAGAAAGAGVGSAATAATGSGGSTAYTPESAGAPAAGSGSAGSSAVAGASSVPSVMSAQSASSVQSAPSAPPALGANSSQAQREPMSPRAKKRLIAGCVSLGALLLLLVGAAIAISVLNNTVFSPKHEAEQYVQAISEGRFGDAVKMSPVNAKMEEQILLTNEIGAKTKGRIDGYEFNDVEVHGGAATVNVTLKANGESTEKNLRLTRKGSKYLFFSEWQLEEQDYASVDIEPMLDANGVMKVNGVDVNFLKALDAQDQEHVVVVPAFPGTYDLTPAAPSDSFEATPGKAVVPLEGSGQMVEEPNVALSQKGKDEINAQVKAKIDACVKSTTAAEGTGECAFLRAYTYEQQGPGAWSVVTYPEIRIDESPYSGIEFSTETYAKFRYTYKAKDWDGTIKPQQDDNPEYMRGMVNVDDSGKLTVTMEN